MYITNNNRDYTRNFIPVSHTLFDVMLSTADTDYYCSAIHTSYFLFCHVKYFDNCLKYNI
jgi:hypothetical protein